jgi:cell division protein FtsB
MLTILSKYSKHDNLQMMDNIIVKVKQAFLILALIVALPLLLFLFIHSSTRSMALNAINSLLDRAKGQNDVLAPEVKEDQAKAEALNKEAQAIAETPNKPVTDDWYKDKSFTDGVNSK